MREILGLLYGCDFAMLLVNVAAGCSSLQGMCLMISGVVYALHHVVIHVWHIPYSTHDFCNIWDPANMDAVVEDAARRLMTMGAPKDSQTIIHLCGLIVPLMVTVAWLNLLLQPRPLLQSFCFWGGWKDLLCQPGHWTS